MERVRTEASAPVDAASVAVFRIAFGVAVVVNVALYVPVLAREYYMEPSFLFGFGPLQVPAPPGQGIRLAYLATAVAGALVAVGWHTRLAAAGVLVTHTYVFLLDSSYFQNHEYLLSLLALLLVAMPTDRRWSVAARRRRLEPTVPRGVVWMLRFQVGVPYVYGGLAKLNGGDWFVGEPLRLWLAGRTDIEPIDTILTTEAVVLFMAYGALVFDLMAVPALLHPRTRRPAFAVAVCFHLTNAWLFGLFIFPWLMIAATTIFFDPDWPLRLASWVRERRLPAGEDDAVTAPAPAAASAASAASDAAGTEPVAGAGPSRALRSGALVAAAVWIVVQLLVPLRHLVIPGDPSWTEQAHRFSWHMRLRDKQSTVTFVVGDGDRVVRVDPREHLGAKQAARLGGHPERLVVFARHLSTLHDDAPVRAETSVSLNGRAPQPIVDPDVDLSRVTYRSHRPNDWILPLDSPRVRTGR